jgi:hypothetical protein
VLVKSVKLIVSRLAGPNQFPPLRIRPIRV